MKRRYLYEVDFMRNFFIIGVLSNHIVGICKNIFEVDSPMYLILACIHSSLHFTRMGFMFMTGLVLFLAYQNREIKATTFWKKRYFLIGIPYLFWNLIYSLPLLSSQGFQATLTHFYSSVIHGDQAYLYYVLVTMQLYLIFPFLLNLMKKYKPYLKLVWIISLLIQCMITYFIKYKIGNYDTTNWPYLFSHYGIFVGSYQFYFISGGITALYYDQLIALIQKHTNKIKYLLLIMLPTIWLYYFWNRFVLGLSDKAAKSVHQPLFILYALVMIIFVLYYGIRWSQNGRKNKQSMITKWITTGARLSFGIYLTQAVGISLVAKFIIPILSNFPSLVIPAIPFLIAMVYGLSFAISKICYQTPVLSYVIGRKYQKKGSI
ncbi:MAG: acyltransferase [Streptococcaceae bacterium]|nr:acyltransferase [Streptococcaceae bacterium]MCH4177107.1 acyltransferase [Streptococcaceae bacterium]